MDQNNSPLIISKHDWVNLIQELACRGEGRKESGAFLLGKPGGNLIEFIVYFDDLDPNCLTGMIEFSASGFVKLWDYCSSNQLTVLADVHTHPYNWTGQSLIDKQNPMIPVQGHIAIIIPHYSCKKNQMLRGIGIYEFLGGVNWKKLKTTKIKLQP